MITFKLHPHSVSENIFFVHGNLCSARFWEPSIDALTQIFNAESKGSLKGSALAIDYPGCGQSPAPQKEDIHIEKMADQFIELIKTQNFAPCHLVGHSAGGLIAAVMLAKAPELFKKTLLLDPVGAKGVKFNDVMLPTFEAMKSDKNLTATIIGSTIYNNNPENSFFQDVIVEDAFTAVKNVGSWVLEALDGIDYSALLSTIQKPVLVLHGEHDTLLSMEDSKDLANIIHGTFDVIPGQGHCFNVEAPEKFALKLQSYTNSKN